MAVEILVMFALPGTIRIRSAEFRDLTGNNVASLKPVTIWVWSRQVVLLTMEEQVHEVS